MKLKDMLNERNEYNRSVEKSFWKLSLKSGEKFKEGGHYYSQDVYIPVNGGKSAAEKIADKYSDGHYSNNKKLYNLEPVKINIYTGRR